MTTIQTIPLRTKIICLYITKDYSHLLVSVKDGKIFVITPNKKALKNWKTTFFLVAITLIIIYSMCQILFTVLSCHCEIAFSFLKISHLSAFLFLFFFSSQLISICAYVFVIVMLDFIVRFIDYIPWIFFNPYIYIYIFIHSCTLFYF